MQLKWVLTFFNLPFKAPLHIMISCSVTHHVWTSAACNHVWGVPVFNHSTAIWAGYGVTWSGFKDTTSYNIAHTCVSTDIGKNQEGKMYIPISGCTHKTQLLQHLGSCSHSLRDVSSMRQTHWTADPISKYQMDVCGWYTLGTGQTFWPGRDQLQQNALCDSSGVGDAPNEQCPVPSKRSSTAQWLIQAHPLPHTGP